MTKFVESPKAQQHVNENSICKPRLCSELHDIRKKFQPKRTAQIKFTANNTSSRRTTEDYKLSRLKSA